MGLSYSEKLVEVMRRYSSQTYQTKALKEVERGRVWQVSVRITDAGMRPRSPIWIPWDAAQVRIAAGSVAVLTALRPFTVQVEFVVVAVDSELDAADPDKHELGNLRASTDLAIPRRVAPTPARHRRHRPRIFDNSPASATRRGGWTFVEGVQ
jgi:hypothetical protein